MTQQLTPASGREDPRPRTEANITADSDLGVRPGESNPARMLSGVLLLVVAMIIMALALAWWLA